jgi:uridine monophosphate synthetase
MADFFERLDTACSTKDSLLCVGLDPRLASHPTSIRHSVAEYGTGESIKQAIISANRRLIEQTLPYAAAYKPNMAFYEAWGAHGISALEETIRLIPTDGLIILDAKRNDIGATAAAYAQSAFEHFDADAVTLNPYMGKDAIEPFLDYRERGVFVLCRTSNPGAGSLQDLIDRESGEPLYMRVAREAVSWSERVGLVVAGNDLASLKAVRDNFPDVWFLAPGIGAQGGSAADAINAGQRRDGMGVLAVVGRAIAEADDPGSAACRFRDELNGSRRKGILFTAPGVDTRSPDPSTEWTEAEGMATGTAQGAFSPQSAGSNVGAADDDSNRRRAVLHGLVRSGCFRVGEFTLKSGVRSPFYIDLRRTVSDPVFLKLIAQAYVRISRDLDFDRIAGIPVAALPLATAVSLETGVPMIYPRIPQKQHGTGNRIEGDYRPGERVLLLDDLITTGLSKLEAVEVLRSEGLEVNDLAVLIERGGRGRADMAKVDIHLHAFAHVIDLFSTCREMGVIDEAEELRMRKFVEEGN